MEETELDELKRDLVDVARGRYECDNIEPVDPAMSDQAVLESILCIHQPHYVSPVIEKYVRHPKICGALSQITAAHLPFWDGSVKCMQSMYFVKPPNFQGSGLAPRRDLHPHAGPLANRRVDRRGTTPPWKTAACTSSQGRTGPGYLYPQRSHENPDEFDFAPESYGFDESVEIPVEVEAGALVFFNGYLLHRSYKNRGHTYRRVLVNHYCNAWMPVALEH